jgi:hypothetical protein
MRRFRAKALGLKLCFLARARILSRVFSLIKPLPDKARDTVPGVTPAIFAKSAMLRTCFCFVISRQIVWRVRSVAATINHSNSRSFEIAFVSKIPIAIDFRVQYERDPSLNGACARRPGERRVPEMNIVMYA